MRDDDHRREPELDVGHAVTSSAAIARRTRAAATALVTGAALLALALVAAQARFAPAAFEFGVERRFTGSVREHPVPLLAVDRPGQTAGGGALSHFLLVAPGKHGAAPDVRGLDGRRVELAGTLVYREGTTMIELVPGSIAPLAGAAAAPASATDLGVQTLLGEIVDGKCHLGVMRPGEGKTHRDCAVRCISGGVPPMLRIAGRDGETTRLLLLVGADGRAVNRDILDRVAEPVAVTGRVKSLGDLLVVYADPADIRRVGEGS